MPSWRDLVSRYDGVSLREWLNRRGVSPGMQDLLGVLDGLESVYDVSGCRTKKDCFNYFLLITDFSDGVPSGAMSRSAEAGPHRWRKRSGGFKIKVAFHNCALMLLQLPLAFEPLLRDNIVYHSKVTHIQQTKDYVKVE